jgi:hypothetical protein
MPSLFSKPANSHRGTNLVRIYTHLEYHSSTKQEQGKHAQDACTRRMHDVDAIAQTTKSLMLPGMAVPM